VPSVQINRSLIAGLASLSLLTASCGDDGSEGEPVTTPDAGSEQTRFSAAIDHPFVPLSAVRTTVFKGKERDPASGETTRIRIESRVLDREERLAGVTVAVVEVKDYEDGELVERTLDYYAQHDDGSVWYFGERVDDYENGKVVGHDGAWLAGEGDAQAGVFMPTEPKVGDEFEQERAPGVAEDRSTVVAVGLEVTTPAGIFADCIKTKDFAPLDNATEYKYYCPGVGLVREEPPGGRIDLVRYG
jgi:hypothetical protein